MLTDNTFGGYNLQTERVFDEIHATLLSAILPEQECFNDQCVEDVLMDELEKFINSHMTKLDYSVLRLDDDYKQDSTRMDSYAQSYIKSRSMSKIIECSSRKRVILDQDDMAHLVSESVAQNVSRKRSHIDDLFEMCNSLEKDYRLLELPLHFESVSIKLSSNNQLLSVPEDLPQDYSEIELECLVASLDNANDD
jgi:hypothetical protein